MTSRLCCVGLLCGSLLAGLWLQPATAAGIPEKVHRILFLGDSITYDGRYVAMVEAWLALRMPDRALEVINVGLPSETVSGLSEIGHAGGKFPRPDLHERLERLLKATKPDLVFACYGMNDGIYLPLAEDRFRKFQEGMQRLHESVVASGAQIVHLTPPVFDPVPIKARTSATGPTEQDSRPYEKYNEVLDRYSDWLLAQRPHGWEVVDLHGPINHYLAEQRRSNPNFNLAGDGVHPGDVGHWLMTKPILLYLGAAEAASAADPQAMVAGAADGAQLLKLTRQRMSLMRDAWLTSTGHKRPGMAKGEPLPQAQAKAQELTTKIKESVKRP
jgi:lysophospholipase L1-like esterase